MSGGASRLHLISELTESDATVLVLVHLLNDFIHLLLRDVEASALDDSLKFISCDTAIGIQV